MKKTFKIPVSWEMYGYVYVEAEDLEEACSIAEVSETIGIPDNGEYVDCSWRVDWEVAEMFNEEK